MQFGERGNCTKNSVSVAASTVFKPIFRGKTKTRAFALNAKPAFFHTFGGYAKGRKS